jgi:hypothetical protein
MEKKKKIIEIVDSSSSEEEQHPKKKKKILESESEEEEENEETEENDEFEEEYNSGEQSEDETNSKSLKIDEEEEEEEDEEKNLQDLDSGESEKESNEIIVISEDESFSNSDSTKEKVVNDVYRISNVQDVRCFKETLDKGYNYSSMRIVDSKIDPTLFKKCKNLNILTLENCDGVDDYLFLYLPKKLDFLALRFNKDFQQLDPTIIPKNLKHLLLWAKDLNFKNGLFPNELTTLYLNGCCVDNKFCESIENLKTLVLSKPHITEQPLEFKNSNLTTLVLDSIMLPLCSIKTLKNNELKIFFIDKTYDKHQNEINQFIKEGYNCQKIGSDKLLSLLETKT